MKQKVIVTIDTEGHDGKDPISKLIFGDTFEGRYGIEYIMDVLDESAVKALFFVDFAEAWDYGEEKVQKVVNAILQRGHNVGVHIHPDHMADKSKLFLWEYSKEEQYDIIKKCTDLYVKMVGKQPLSFRAGKYSANYDTLDILCDLGYKYDFSSFYHQQWCGINPEFTINAPCQYKSLIEFPVTMHTTFRLGPIIREDKIDIEGMSKGELRYALKQVISQDFPVVVTLFFHSFSLLDWREQPDAPKKSWSKIGRLRKAIKYVNKHPELEFIDENSIDKVLPVESDVAMKSNIEWKLGCRGVFYTYRRALLLAKYNKKAKYLVIGSGFFCIMFIGSIQVIRRLFCSKLSS